MKEEGQGGDSKRTAQAAVPLNSDDVEQEDPNFTLLREILTKRHELEAATYQFTPEKNNSTKKENGTAMATPTPTPAGTATATGTETLNSAKKLAPATNTNPAEILGLWTHNNDTDIDDRQQLVGQQLRQESAASVLPGAYARAPNGDGGGTRSNSQDRTTTAAVPSSLSHGTTIRLPVTPTNDDNNHANNTPLAVANPVQDDTEVGDQDRPQADPVDLEALERKQAKRKKQKQTFLFLLAVMALAAAAIIGTVAGTRNKSAHVQFLTMTPTVFGSVEPSEVPSSAPTASLDLLLEKLPDDTLESLQSGITPQYKAWAWMVDHQNITFLPEWRKMQLFALATFFYSMEGEEWNPLIRARWMDDTLEECLWFSSGYGWFQGEEYLARDPQFPSCNHLGEFTSLYLYDLQLLDKNPAVPPEIALLTALSQVRLGVNDVGVPWTQFLPFVLYQLTGLRTLDLEGNAMTGSVSTEIGQLSNIEMLRLWQNRLTGSLPTELGLLTGLTFLELGLNLFTGQIPSELGQLTALTTLSLHENQVQGQIPSELGHCIALQELLLSANQLSRLIPEEFEQFTALTDLGLWMNQLSGQLPSEVGLLPSLRNLWLHDNQLIGVLPTELWSMQSLSELDVSNNALTGSLPIDIGLSATTEQIDLSGNLLSSSIPTEVGLLLSLQKLHLHNNSFTGILPTQLKEFMGLRLDGNNFTGTVPQHLCSALWCDCSTNVTLASTCNDLTASLDFPGRFPPRATLDRGNDTIVLNIQTDYYPEDTTWLWQEQESNVVRAWATLQNSSEGLSRKRHLYSSIFHVSHNNMYQLVISDSYSDGLVFGTPGWITVTGADQELLYAFTEAISFTEITLRMFIGEDGQIEMVADVYCDPAYQECRYSYG